MVQVWLSWYPTKIEIDVDTQAWLLYEQFGSFWEISLVWLGL